MHRVALLVPLNTVGDTLNNDAHDDACIIYKLSRVYIRAILSQKYPPKCQILPGAASVGGAFRRLQEAGVRFHTGLPSPQK